MRAGSFDIPPSNGEASHQIVDNLFCVMVRVGCQVRVLGGGQDGAMAEDFLYLEQIDARFDQMSGVAVAQAMQGDLFFIPQSATTLRIVV